VANDCIGRVIVNGENKESVLAFCRLFVYTEDEDQRLNHKFFSRSFMHMSWADFMNGEDCSLGETSAEFTVIFAWSASSCIMEPRGPDDECIDLMTACKQHKVSVVIDTEEPGFDFEEHIEVNEDGEVVADECLDMPHWICESCGNEQSIPTSYDVSFEACYECEKEGPWRKKSEELPEEPKSE